MEFGQEYYDIYRDARDTDSRIPFYMTYPMKNVFLEEAKYENDCLRLQELYPADAKRIQAAVSAECDKMEYEGSLMFDEYPDRLMLRLICRRVWRELFTEEEGSSKGGPDSAMFQLIEVMLVQEMYRRRCRYRRCRRWY